MTLFHYTVLFVSLSAIFTGLSAVLVAARDKGNGIVVLATLAGVFAVSTGTFLTLLELGLV